MLQPLSTASVGTWCKNEQVFLPFRTGRAVGSGTTWRVSEEGIDKSSLAESFDSGIGGTINRKAKYLGVVEIGDLP